MSNSPSSTEDRALALLGNGLEAKVVASALGVTESRISQLLSQESFAEKVALLRYENLAAHSVRDNMYDSIESDLLEKLKASLTMLFDPMKVLKVLQVVNAAKRRGASTPEAMLSKQPTVTLNVPTILLQHFSTQNNVHNQVININGPTDSSQSLVTIQSGALDSLRSSHGSPKPESLPLVSQSS